MSYYVGLVDYEHNSGYALVCVSPAMLRLLSRRHA